MIEYWNNRYMDNSSSSWFGVVGFAVFRQRKRKESGSSGKQFLMMGITWVVAGLVYGLWRGTNVFDIGLFNLGLIFTVAGISQLLIERYWRKSQ